MAMEHRQQTTETLQRRLEGPGSEDRLRSLNRRFKAIAVGAKAQMPDWKYCLLVMAIFVASGAVVLLW